jgi:phosphoesterase RecJ-like protein
MITKIIDEGLIQEAKSLIEDAENIVITTHVSPDGDAIGSSLALCNFLKTIGKEAYVVVPNDLPGFLKWMSGASDIIVYEKKKSMADALIEKADLICALDFNVLKRIENVAISVADSAAKKLMLDHHLNPGNFANVVISYPQFASTSEMVFRLICRMGYFTEMTKECAECIYTGMMTDTGGFTYNSNNAEVYIIISELIKKGIDSGCGTDAPGSFIAWLSTQTPVYTYEMPGHRYDIGTLATYEAVKKAFRAFCVT